MATCPNRNSPTDSADEAKGYFPCAAILSGQIDNDVLFRYRAEKWSVVTGVVGAENPVVSTYDFMRQIIGYDLAAFFRT